MTGARWRALFAVSVLLTLAVGQVLRDTPGYMVHNPDGTTTGDITHYIYWIHLVTLGGIQAAYSGAWPETYAVYAPVTLLPFEAIGILYQHLQDPSFDPEAAQQSLWLHAAIKLVALTWHLLTGAAIFLLLRKSTTERLAAISASLYLLNPAALYDVAHWAQPDGAHALFTVLAVGLLELDQLVPAWASMAAAAFAKPQAWFVLPLVTLATFTGFGPRGLVRGLASGGVVAVVIALPFVATGHLGELASLPGTVSTVMPVVSADAHNLWWLVLQLRGQDPLLLQDSARALGPLTYRVLAAALVAATIVLTCWLCWTRRASLAEAAALGVLGWFTFTTQAHENHLFFALPLLALAWPARPWLLAPFATISVTLLLNMFLHDTLVLEALGRGLEDPAVVRLRLVNAVLNVSCFVCWSVWAATRRAEARGTFREYQSLGYSEPVVTRPGGVL